MKTLMCMLTFWLSSSLMATSGLNGTEYKWSKGEACEDSFLAHYKGKVDADGTVLVFDKLICKRVSELLICLDEDTDNQYWVGDDRIVIDNVAIRNLRSVAYPCYRSEIQNSYSEINFKMLGDLTKSCVGATIHLTPNNIEIETTRLGREHKCRPMEMLTQCIDHSIVQYKRENPSTRVSNHALEEIIISMNYTHIHQLWRACEKLKRVFHRARDSPCLKSKGKWKDLQEQLKNCDRSFEETVFNYTEKDWKQRPLCRFLHEYSLCRNNIISVSCGYDLGSYHYQLISLENKALFRGTCQTPNGLESEYLVDCYTLKKFRRNTPRSSSRRFLSEHRDTKAYCKYLRNLKGCWKRNKLQCKSKLYRSAVRTELKLKKELCTKQARDRTDVVEDSVTLDVKHETKTCEQNVIKDEGSIKWETKLDQNIYDKDTCDLVTSLVLCIVEKTYSKSRNTSRPSLPSLIKHIVATGLRYHLLKLAARCFDVKSLFETAQEHNARLDASVKEYENTAPAKVKATICKRGMNASMQYVAAYYSDLNRTFWCDTTTDGGGWFVIQRRYKQDTNFDRSFAEYEQGFGELSGDFWVGLKDIYNLTTKRFRGYTDLRIELKVGGIDYYAVYEYTTVFGPGSDYHMSYFNISGSLDGHRSGFSSSSGETFSTYDKKTNSQTHGKNCSVELGGGWWFPDNCGMSNPNGRWHDGKIQKVWRIFDEALWMDAVSTEMKLRPSPDRCENGICGWTPKERK